MRTFIPSEHVEASTTTWERAYQRFETRDEEIKKCVKRLHFLGAGNWPRDARVVELFCGRGSGLFALSRLGFTDVQGIDLSARLLAVYGGAARTIVGDCRDLPWSSESKDILIVQGGLHHLPNPEAELERVLAEACRVLVRGGRFVAVEPWLTPFLQSVHAASFSPLRRFSAKLDAFATMVEHERETYEKWLTSKASVLSRLGRYFETEQLRQGRGKLQFVGVRR